MKIRDVVLEVENGLIATAIVNKDGQLVINVRKAEPDEEQKEVMKCQKYDYGKSNCFVFCDINKT